MHPGTYGARHRTFLGHGTEINYYSINFSFKNKLYINIITNMFLNYIIYSDKKALSKIQQIKKNDIYNFKIFFMFTKNLKYNF